MGPRAGEATEGSLGLQDHQPAPAVAGGRMRGQFEYRELEGPETGSQLPFPNPSLAHRLLGQEHH